MAINCLPRITNIRLMQGQGCSIPFTYELLADNVNGVRFAWGQNTTNCNCGDLIISENWLTPWTIFTIGDYAGSIAIPAHETKTRCPGIYTYAVEIGAKDGLGISTLIQTGRINLLYNPLNQYTPCGCSCCQGLRTC